MKVYSLFVAWIIVCIATLGSLYFSEIRHIEPCHLCWYQRICLYPLVIILGMAVYNGFTAIVPYVFPLAVIALIVAGYQIALQEIPSLHLIDMCGSGPSCSEKIDVGLGFITLPMLSAFSIALLILFLYMAWPEYHKKK